jgi:hypothetical protein
MFVNIVSSESLSILIISSYPVVFPFLRPGFNPPELISIMRNQILLVLSSCANGAFFDDFSCQKFFLVHFGQKKFSYFQPGSFYKFISSLNLSKNLLDLVETERRSFWEKSKAMEEPHKSDHCFGNKNLNFFQLKFLTLQ